MLRREAALANGQKETADESLKAIVDLVSASSWRYTDADDLVVLGRASLLLGADPRDVQEGFFERARRNFKTRPDGFLAAGRLALEKGDLQLAGEILGPAAKSFPDDPEIQFAWSEAIRGTNRKTAGEALLRALEINPQFAAAICRVAEQQIDGEDYAGAEATLGKVFAFNPHHPESHALQAVIHHVRNDTNGEQASYLSAVQFSKVNPAVDHLIGRKLSAKYCFAEGAVYQRKALETDPAYEPARIQLAQDLLRLGEESEGWELAQVAHKNDGYNTTVFNLLQLQKSLDKYQTLTSPHFVVRMEKKESQLYGERVISLLEEAWAQQAERYGYAPGEPVIVEIFSRSDDFAVRTFGMPDVAGFLGVCFGPVITANSPATRRETPASWESILWHEFCHVTTLQMTGNRIPRWLSEGISVYEERRRDKRWGQSMNGEFRDRILDGKVTPVSQLSQAFLTAESGEDLNFAYFESSMVVEHFVDRFGLEALIAVLNDLNTGLQINDALERHSQGLTEFESSFGEWLNGQAMAYAPEAVFRAEELGEIAAGGETALQDYVRENPKSFPALLVLAGQYVSGEQYEPAEVLLKELIALAPLDTSSNGPRRLLATVYEKQGKTEAEAAVLTEHLSLTADDLSAILRLQRIRSDSGDSAGVIELGKLVQAVDPFQTESLEMMAAAAESSSDAAIAAQSLESLLVLRPDDAARLHFRIADLVRASDPARARRHVLLSLSTAPRYREAHQLLLELAR